MASALDFGKQGLGFKSTRGDISKHAESKFGNLLYNRYWTAHKYTWQTSCVVAGKADQNLCMENTLSLAKHI